MASLGHNELNIPQTELTSLTLPQVVITVLDQCEMSLLAAHIGIVRTLKAIHGTLDLFLDLDIGGQGQLLEASLHKATDDLK